MLSVALSSKHTSPSGPSALQDVEEHSNKRSGFRWLERYVFTLVAQEAIVALLTQCFRNTFVEGQDLGRV